MDPPTAFDSFSFKADIRDREVKYSDAEINERFGRMPKDIWRDPKYSCLNEEQRLVVESVLFCNYSVFFTGPAGTGKSHVLNTIKLLNRESVSPKRIAFTAMTGIAGVAIGGGTLNSWAGIGLGGGSAADLAKRVMGKDPSKKRWNDLTDILVIDEMSMMEAGMWEKLDLVGRKVRRGGQGLPFGGLKLVLCGDFFQLPPVKTQVRARED